MQVDSDSSDDDICPKTTTASISLDFADISDSRCMQLTGLSRSQFLELYDSIKKHKLSGTMSMINGLGFYFTRLKTGLSIRMLEALIPIAAAKQIGIAINEIRAMLSKQMVPKNLGFNHIKRSDLIMNHTTDISKTLLASDNNTLISIWDATYIYIQKSSNYAFQRATYSMHKYRNLVKFMLLCTTDGYIIDAIGPYLANYSNNDASILEHTFEAKINDLEDNFEPEDIFVVDRGFRDCLNYLESKNFEYKMPAFLQKAKQHTDLEANSSRLVTKVRLKHNSYLV